MKTQYIYYSPGISWSLFADEKAEFFYKHTEEIASVMSHVRRIFIKLIFGANVVNAHPVLSVLPTSDDPEVFRLHTIIFINFDVLTSVPDNQKFLPLVYQFSHELCHFMVPSDVCENYQWLDETLAQMMSWYAMHRIHRTRESNPCEVLIPFYDSMVHYIEKDMNDRDDLQGASLSQFICQHWEHLCNDPYDRPRNNAIAYEIYPIFCEYPELWGIVPFLNRLTPDMTLEDALRTLQELAGLAPGVGDLLHQRSLDE